MGFWNSIFGKKKKEIIVDDFFGELTVEDEDYGLYESNRHFSPLNAVVLVFLGLDDDKNTHDQKFFFQLIEEKFDELIPIFIKHIEFQFSHWRDDVIIKDFKKEFTINSINLGLCNSEPIEWSIYFDTIYDLDHTIIFEMKDFEVEDVLIDG